MSRVKNSVRNILVSVVGQFIQIVVQFISRSIFIKYLSADYLGLNGLFVNILGVLSLAEMGFGTALLYCMYKPIYNDDKDEIRRIVNLYKKVYRYICTVIGVLGLLLLPFLHLFISDYELYSDLGNIELFYVIYLINTICSYLNIYKRSVVEAYQKNYIYVSIQKIMMVVQNAMQICFLIITRNYMVFLLIQVFFTIATNMVISYKVDKKFPFLNEDKKSIPQKSKRKEILKNSGAMAMHKIGAVFVGSTDNIIISSMVGLVCVGIYSNYLLIISNLCSFIELIFKAVTASVGDLGASDNRKRLTEVFNTLTFIEFWIFGFSSVCLYVLINHFIYVWIGEKFIFDSTIVFVLVLNFYLKGMRVVINIYRDSLGLFWYDRYKPICESLINLVFSILLVKIIGVIGVFIGTAISTLTVCFWVEPYVLFKYSLEGKLPRYYFKYFEYALFTFVSGFIINYLCDFFELTLMGLFYKIIVIFVIYNVLSLIVFGKCKEFADALRTIKRIM